MFRDRLSAKDVAGVLSRFEQRPDEYGWVVLIGGGREIALEMGGANDYDGMPPAMVKQATRALGILFGKPKTRLSVMCLTEVGEDEWEWILNIARAFAERWKVVIYDHAQSVYAIWRQGRRASDGGPSSLSGGPASFATAERVPCSRSHRLRAEDHLLASPTGGRCRGSPGVGRSCRTGGAVPDPVPCPSRTGSAGCPRHPRIRRGAAELASRRRTPRTAACVAGSTSCVAVPTLPSGNTS
jgi:hypothetical protein